MSRGAVRIVAGAVLALALGGWLVLALTTRSFTVAGFANEPAVTRGGTLLRNGEPAHDGRSHGPTTFPALTVPAGRVFLLGDNRGNSQDSRFFGPVPLDQVRGRIVSTHGRLALLVPATAVLAALALGLTFRRTGGVRTPSR